MRPVNRSIVVGAFLIMATGVYTVFFLKHSKSANLTRVLVGGYILAIIASVMELLGGPMAAVASGLVWLAFAAALLAILPDVLSRVSAFSSITGVKP